MPYGRALRAFLAGIGALLAAVFVLIATVVGVASVLDLVADRDSARPLSVPLALLGFAGTALLGAAAAAGAAAWMLRRAGWVNARAPATGGAVIYVLGLLLLTALHDNPLPEENLVAQLFAARSDPAYDVVLVVDPAEPGGRRLVRGAREVLRRSDEPWDVAFGLAVVDGHGGWRLQLAPTRRPGALAAALGRLDDRGPEHRRSAYGPALVALADTPHVPWRDGTQRAVVVVHDALPATPELGPQPPLTEAQRLLPLLRPPPSGVGAFAALQPRLPSIGYSPGAVGLYLAVDRDGGSAQPWSRWLAGAGGWAITTQGGLPPDAVLDTFAGAHDPGTDALAARFRPRLYFDRHEPYRPLDVGRFLAETAAGHPAHEVCQASLAHVADLCRPLGDGRLPPDWDYLRLAEGARLRPDTDRTPQRMYFHATRKGDTLQLDYWWFYRFNLSPVASRAMCAAGIGVADISCYDHEGDWEGVTVTLHRADGGWTAERVTYAGHEWQYSYDWPALVDAGRTDGDHARVYVAYGSHASYPRPCAARVGISDATCHQPRRVVPDGPRDGHDQWIYNDDERCRRAACVARLPVLSSDQPALWNAFGGRWGRAYCVYGFKVCVRTAGPKSPSYQERYDAPGKAAPGRSSDL